MSNKSLELLEKEIENFYKNVNTLDGQIKRAVVIYDSHKASMIPLTRLLIDFNEVLTATIKGIRNASTEALAGVYSNENIPHNKM